MANNETAQLIEPPTDREEPYFQTEHLKADLAGRTARGGAVTIVTQGLKFLIGMIATVILARLLKPQDYGLIGMVAVPVASPLVGIGVCLLIVFLITLLVLSATAAGRSALRDVKASIFLLMRRNREPFVGS